MRCNSVASRSISSLPWCCRSSHQVAPASSHPPAAHGIQGGDLAGELVRTPAGDRSDKRSQPDPGRGQRRSGQQHPRVAKRATMTSVQHVIPDEQPVPARLLRRRGKRRHRPRIGEVPEVRDVDREAHAGMLPDIAAEVRAGGLFCGDSPACRPQHRVSVLEHGHSTLLAARPFQKLADRPDRQGRALPDRTESGKACPPPKVAGTTNSPAGKPSVTDHRARFKRTAQPHGSVSHST
jgi:hypothetical protein